MEIQAGGHFLTVPGWKRLILPSKQMTHCKESENCCSVRRFVSKHFEMFFLVKHVLEESTLLFYKARGLVDIHAQPLSQSSQTPTNNWYFGILTQIIIKQIKVCKGVQ